MTTPPTPDSSTTGRALLAALEALGPTPALAWYGEASRIELSGHVLANWVIKAIGHLHDEVALDSGDTVVLDLAPHWKRLALALAAWSLGGEVVMLPRTGAEDPSADDAAEPLPVGVEDPRVVITDRPDSALADTADEVLAVQPVSLAPRYDGELPPLARDWLVEVRASSDRLGVALPAWSGPAPDSDEGRTGAAPRLLVTGDGLEAAPRVLGAVLAGGGIVGPAAEVVSERADAEGVTDRA